MTRPPSQVPTVVQLAERLLKEIEQAVSAWPRKHRYVHGTTLRQQAMKLAQLAHRAWREPSPRRESWVEQLVWQVDDVKLSLQLGQQIRAFNSFGQFESIARVAADLGRQVGGWSKQLHRKGQNDAAHPSAAQRAQILSPRDTSQGVTR